MTMSHVMTPANLPAAAGASARVLVIEDADATRSLIEMVLRRRGYIAWRAAPTASPASQMVRSWQPDLVVLDIALPGLDGWDILAHLRADPATADLPVVVTTAHAAPEITARARREGAAAMVPKPFSPAELRAAVSGLLRGSRRDRADRPPSLPALLAGHAVAHLRDGRGRAVALTIPAVSSSAGVVMGYFLYPIASVASAAFLIGSASRCRGQERWAWIVLGLGVGFWALGECAWQGYVIGGIEVPYPGLADIFYVLGYPLMLAGVLLLPHLRSGRYERLRLTLDATVGTVALSIVMWVTYLSRVVAWDSGTGFLENVINAFYPAGDVILLLAVMILALRRSEYRYDPRLLAISGGLVATAAADIIYYAQVEAGTFPMGAGWMPCGSAATPPSWWLPT